MRTLTCCFLLIVLPSAVFPQSHEAADAPRRSLLVGAEFSAYNPDFSCFSTSPVSCGSGRPLIKGVGVFADYSLYSRLGIEGNARWLPIDGWAGQKEATYLAGARYKIYQHKRLGFSAKFLLGIGAITTAYYPAPNTLKGTLFVYAPSGDVEYGISKKLSIRVNYELQKWPKFAVSPPHIHSLSPNGFSLGISYKIR